MGYLLGTDEAGYGPNLGPLVVSATLWHVPHVHTLKELARIDLYERFRPYVSADTPQDGHCPSQPVWIADSKRLYKPGGGIHHLESGVLGSLATIGEVANTDAHRKERPSRWMHVWETLTEQSSAALLQSPWYKHFDEDLPIDASEADVRQATAALDKALVNADVRLVTIRSAVVFPQRFNHLLEIHGKKSDILSKTTLGLVARLMQQLPRREPVFVNCDKHGGRNRYGPLIQAEFPDTLVEVHGESRPLSIYRFGQEQNRAEIRFQAKGEGFLPAALASMTSKYLRELAMRAFNEFWCHRVDDLKPTAGYPVDARRFHLQIKSLQQRLRIGDAAIWRRK